jgi:hypothetical protein
MCVRMVSFGVKSRDCSFSAFWCILSSGAVYFFLSPLWPWFSSSGIFCPVVMPISVAALCFQVSCFMGRRYASISKAGLAVALKAPVIVLAALAWMLCSMLSVFWVYGFFGVLAFDRFSSWRPYPGPRPNCPSSLMP